MEELQSRRMCPRSWWLPGYSLMKTNGRIFPYAFHQVADVIPLSIFRCSSNSELNPSTARGESRSSARPRRTSPAGRGSSASPEPWGRSSFKGSSWRRRPMICSEVMPSALSLEIDEDRGGGSRERPPARPPPTPHIFPEEWPGLSRQDDVLRGRGPAPPLHPASQTPGLPVLRRVARRRFTALADQGEDAGTRRTNSCISRIFSPLITLSRTGL